MKNLLTLLLAFSMVCSVVSVTAVEMKVDEHNFEVPDGYTVERVAGPPLVDRPISADFDEKGRLYVTDSSGSNAPLKEQLKNPSHRVMRLEDTDGDGIFDKSVVFADKMIFPEGAMWYDGSLYVAAPPSIWKLTDTDDDGHADQRIQWYQGKTLTGCGNDLHGPYLGPAGWIYWAKGAWDEQTFDRPGAAPLVTRAAHLYRCPADSPIDPKTGSIVTSGIEPVMTGGMDNPVEIAFPPGGERFFTSTFVVHPGGGFRDGVVHSIYGGVYGKSKEEVFVGHPRTGELMPIFKHLGAAAPSGLTSYESEAFGKNQQGTLFASLFNMRKITRYPLTHDGAGFVSQDEDFLVSDHVDFHPTDVLEDADGSLIVVNTGGWYKLCCPTSQMEKPDIKGAIYRVRKIAAPRVDDPRGLKLNWAKLNPKDLAALLGDSRPAVRRHAVQTLAKQGDQAIEALRRVLDPHQTGPMYSANATARLNAVWTLARIDNADAREATRIAILDLDDTVRQAAIHSISLWRDKNSVSHLIAVLARNSDHNRRVAAEALGRIGDARAVPALLAAAARTEDRIGQHSLTFALIEIGDAELTQAGLKSENPLTRRVAMIALDQMPYGELEPRDVIPLLISRAKIDPVLRKTADWITARHPEWGDSLVEYFRDELASLGTDDAKSALQQRMGRFVSNSAVRKLLLEVLRDSKFTLAAKTIVLQVMGDSGGKAMPAEWHAEMVRLLRKSQPSLTKEVVAALRKLPASNVDSSALTEELLAVGRNSNWPTELRLAALAAVPGGVQKLEPQLFDLLSQNLDSEQPVSSRAAAVEVLAGARLTSEQLISLTRKLPSVSPLDIDGILKVFERSSEEAVGVALVNALVDSPARSALRTESLKPRLAKFTGKVTTEAQRLYEVLRADHAEQQAYLEHLVATLPVGDIRRGQLVFRSAKAACSSCHAIGYLGGVVGPDLSRIASIRNQRDLLEAVVFPSASLVRSYEPSTVVTTDGVTHNGLIREETSTGILLATGPDKQVRISHEDIEEISPSSVSVMPSGLDKQLSVQQLADLIAFLESRK